MQSAIIILVLQATPGLVLPVERTTGLGCIPAGRTVSYDCTVTDPSGSNALGSTFLEGSVVMVACSGEFANNRITLSHIDFFSQQSDQPCDALSVSVVLFNETEYTSQLNLTASVDLNQTTILCTQSGMNPAMFEDTIVVGGRCM